MATAPLHCPDPPGMARDRWAAPPALLQRVYGVEAITSLEALLLRLAEASPEAAGLGARLVQDGDPPAYAALLRRTWCVLRAGAPPLRGGFPLQQACTQEQVGVCGWVRVGGCGGGALRVCAAHGVRRPARARPRCVGLRPPKPRPTPAAGGARGGGAAPLPRHQDQRAVPGVPRQAAIWGGHPAARQRICRGLPPQRRDR